MNSRCSGSACLCLLKTRRFALLKIRRFAAGLPILCGALLGLLGPASAQAEEVTWFGSDGVWDVASNWWPHKVPIAGDVVWVKAPEAVDLVVTHQDASSPVLTTAFFDSVGTGTLRLLQSQDQLIVTTQHVGYSGTATLEVSGGTNTVAGGLILAFWAAGDGTYQLSDTGALSANREFIGSAGLGRFHHSAGPNAVVGDFHLGFWGSGDGTYELSGTGALSANREHIGNAGTGRFTQTAGTNTVAGDFVVAALAGSDGTYDLSGTGALSANREFIGSAGPGIFRHSGGPNTVAGDFSLGFWGSGDGTYELSGTGTLSDNRAYIGSAGAGHFIHTGGAHTVAGDLVLSILGSADGTYELSGSGALSATNQIVGAGGPARFIQTDATNVVGRYLILGQLGSGHGTYDLSGTGGLSATREYLGDFGTGLFTHSGGANSISESLVLGNWWSGVGTYELSGTGSLEAADEYLGVLGAGSVVQSGGVNTVANTLYLGLFPGSQGDYDLQGGALDAGQINNNIDSHFAYTGGSLTAPLFLNAGELDLGGVGTRTVSGAVTNNGVVRATDTEVVFTETFTNAGAYVSEQSDNSFANLVVGPAGYLAGAQGSRFFVTGDLMMGSNWAEFWDTSLSGLVLGVSPDHEHTLAYTGQDLGDSYAGYVANFAWRSLSVADGESLVLQDSDLVAGGALYVSVLDLQGGLDQIASITGNGLNLYYDAQQPENGYLNGQAYPLAGGGSIVPVPEPAALLLLSSGIAALVLAQWRRARGEGLRA